MKFYYDTEFSCLSASAELISIGIVADSGESFYCELAPMPKRCSQFVKENVIPQLDGGSAIVSKSEFQGRITDWLSKWSDPAELISDSTWDIFVLRKAVAGRGSHNVGPLAIKNAAGETKSISLSITPLLHEGKQAVFDATVLVKRDEGLREHHALSDALILRAGMAAIRDWL